MRCRRLTLLATATLALALPAPASAVVNGASVSVDEYDRYRAQVFVGRDIDGGSIDKYCTGTLIGSRQILTAARCASYGLGVRLPESRFEIRVGDPELTQARQYTVAPDGNVRHPDYDPDTGVFDVAILTLTEPVGLPGFAPVRVVEATEESTMWAVGTPARVVGWGERETGLYSTLLRTGDVARLPDADCAGGTFDNRYMLCAAGAEQNPCEGDSGSPLLVPEGGFFALAGVFSGASCATPDTPGVFARVGAAPLNAWVHAATPEADFDFVERRQPQANVPFELFSTSTHPDGPLYFTDFRWDLDNDLVFDDAVGRQIKLTRPAGEAVVGLQASRPGGDRASIYYSFSVMPDPNDAPAGAGPGTQTLTPTAPPAAVAKPAALATIASAKRPKVGRRGRFTIRVRFARTAPRGTAVIEVFRGKRKIGIARTGVRRGGSKRVKVKLTPTGRRLLKGSKTKRLKVRVRVRVGSAVLRTKTLTIRR